MYRTAINIVGAVCLIGGPLADLIWSLISPINSGASAHANVAAIAANPGAGAAAAALDLAVLLLIPAALFAGRALGSSVRPLAGVGTALLFAGSLAFTYSLAGDVVQLAAARTHGTATAQAFLDSGVVSVSVVVGVIGQLAGFVLLGIAALRSRLIPIWAAILLIGWNFVQVAGTVAGIPAVEGLADALLLAAYAACAVRLFRPVVAPVEPSSVPQAAR